MTIEWFSFLFGMMALLCIEFFAVVIASVFVYNKQKKKSRSSGSTASKVARDVNGKFVA